MKQLRIQDLDYDVVIGRYPANNQPLIFAIDPDTHQVIEVITSEFHLDFKEFGMDCTVLDTENQQLVDALVEAGIIHGTPAHIECEGILMPIVDVVTTVGETIH